MSSFVVLLYINPLKSLHLIKLRIMSVIIRSFIRYIARRAVKSQAAAYAEEQDETTDRLDIQICYAAQQTR